MSHHLLSLVLLLPLAGVAALLACPRDRERLMGAVASAAAALAFSASIPLWLRFAVRGEQWQFTEHLALAPTIGAGYTVGVDGLGLVLLLLTTALFLVAAVTSWTSVLGRIPDRLKEHYVALLLLEAGTAGVFVSLDLLLFVLSWLVAAAAMCLLMGSASDRVRTTLRIAAIAVVPAVVLLGAMLILHGQGRTLTGMETFDLRNFQTVLLPPGVQRWLFALFAFAIGATLAGVFSWWLTLAGSGQIVAGSVVLAAVFLKMGTYGSLRLILPLLPDASRAFAPFVVGVSAIGILFGAVAALAQPNWTRVLAYASLSHISLVMLGAFALTPDGLTGSVVHQINHGVSIAALIVLAGVVAERGKAMTLADYGGLLNAMPVVAALWLLLTLSLVGVPLSNGYVGARLILEGLWSIHRVWSIVAIAGLGLSGVALLWLFARMMLGELRSPGGNALPDLRWREAAILLPLVVLAVWVGLRPARLLAAVETSVARVILRVSPQFAPEVSGCLATPPPPSETGLPAGMVMAAPCVEGSTPASPLK